MIFCRLWVKQSVATHQHDMGNYFKTLWAKILLLILSFSTNTFGQNSKKEGISRYKKLTSLTLNDLKTRSHSELARELSVENFMIYYIDNGKEKLSKKYGQESIDSIYHDSIYTYFVRWTSFYPIDFIKVSTNDIDGIIISDIDGNLIREKFLKEIIPNEDKEKVKRKSRECMSGTDYYDFEYSYNRQKKEVEIKYKWKVTCDFFKVINKTYSATYNISNKSFKN